MTRERAKRSTCSPQQNESWKTLKSCSNEKRDPRFRQRWHHQTVGAYPTVTIGSMRPVWRSGSVAHGLCRAGSHTLRVGRVTLGDQNVSQVKSCDSRQRAQVLWLKSCGSRERVQVLWLKGTGSNLVAQGIFSAPFFASNQLFNLVEFCSIFQARLCSPAWHSPPFWGSVRAYDPGSVQWSRAHGMFITGSTVFYLFNMIHTLLL
jgi:hypothetical protein